MLILGISIEFSTHLFTELFSPTYLRRMNRSQLATKDFHYDLPTDRIARHPLSNRNSSKLLVYNRGQIEETVFSNLENHLPNNAMLVFNDTKVISARLCFKKTTGAIIEVFCLSPYNSTIEEALSSMSSCIWECMVGNLKRIGEGSVLELEIAGVILKAKVYKKRDSDVLIHFQWNGGIPFSDILNKAGQVPLPPYLKRDAEEADKTNYQTVYAKKEGAVAAPTAGLHFVDEQLNALQEAGQKLEYLTLYVGAGTFKPVKSTKLVEHEMHGERILIKKHTIQQLANQNGGIISVGTTSLRSLESLYWLAVKIYENNYEEIPDLDQEDAYQLQSDWNFSQACQFMLDFLRSKQGAEVDFKSSLFIMPGYEWKAINGLITNFHQPGSTLLALIASWVGDDWKRIYEYALQHDFRFLSYGDSSLIIRS